ncbi:MAG: siderophore-iron reductase FhuF [Steroidobacteraceae bacterium]
MIELLKPIFRNELQPYAEALTLVDRSRAGDRSVAQWFGEPALLDDALSRQSRHLRSDDIRPVVSLWTLSYFSVLLPPVIAAASLLDHGFPLDWNEMSLRLDGTGAPVGFSIRRLGERFAQSDSHRRYERLVWDHLDPVIEHLSRHRRVSPRILWGNANRAFAGVFSQSVGLLGSDSHGAKTLLRDHDQLLSQPDWADGRRNPLYFPERRISNSSDVASTTPLHKRCCLLYLIPDKAYCQMCPLAPQYRAARATSKRTRDCS